MSADESLSPNKPKWIRFRLRYFLVAIIALCVLVAWIANERIRIIARRNALNQVVIGFNATPQPTWHRLLFDQDESSFWTGYSVTKLSGDNAFFPEAEIPPLLVKPTQLDIDERKRAVDLAFAFVAEMKQLRTLEVGDQFMDEELVKLKKLTNLRRLSLSGTQVTDDGLNVIRDMPRLDTLNLDDTQIGDTTLGHVGELRHLEILSLKRTRITDAGLMYLKGLSRLRSLSLDGTSISDAGIDQFRTMNQLESLSLRDTDVTEKSVDELRRALPTTNIRY